MAGPLERNPLSGGGLVVDSAQVASNPEPEVGRPCIGLRHLQRLGPGSHRWPGPGPRMQHPSSIVSAIDHTICSAFIDANYITKLISNVGT